MERRYFTQKQANTCAVASLRTILFLQFGIAVKEELLEYGGTDARAPIREQGTGTAELRRMLATADRALNRRRPWTLTVRRFGTVECLVEWLARDRKPMLRMYEPGNGSTNYHMVVLLAVSGDRVKLFDPDTGKAEPIWLSTDDFLDWWTDPDGVRWYAVIGGGEGRLRDGRSKEGD